MSALDRRITRHFATRMGGNLRLRYFIRKLGYSRPMKVAAYQAPLLSAGSAEVIDLIQERVVWCESERVSILCCPEAILGGLADYSENPARLAHHRPLR